MNRVWVVIGLGDYIAAVFSSEEKAKAYVGKRSELYIIQDYEVE